MAPPPIREELGRFVWTGKSHTRVPVDNRGATCCRWREWQQTWGQRGGHRRCLREQLMTPSPPFGWVRMKRRGRQGNWGGRPEWRAPGWWKVVVGGSGVAP